VRCQWLETTVAGSLLANQVLTNRVADGLVSMVRADTAGQVGPGRYHLLPQSLCRLEERLVTEFCIQVGNASQQIELAHGMTSYGGGLPHRGCGPASTGNRIDLVRVTHGPVGR
jgi:hypothetical protein